MLFAQTDIIKRSFEMKGNWVITIGRQFCSGGAEIGQKVAERLGIPYYDKVIIDHTAEKLNISNELIEKHDEKPTSVWDQYGYSWYHGDPSLMLPLSMKISEAQFQIIREYAKNAPCVIVGRCADYILRNHKNVINVFIRCDIEKRVDRATKLYKIDSAEAKKLVRKTDRIRANYYSSHTHDEWGISENYDLIIDSGLFGIDGAAKLIEETVMYLDSKKRG